MANQSKAEEAKSKLEQRKTEDQIEQLIYPTDLLTSKDHPGLCLIFELNKLSYSKDDANQTSGNGLRSRNYYGEENTEVAMQREGDAMAASSVRSSIPGYRKTGLSIVVPPPDQWIENLNIGWTTTEFGALARNAELISSVVKGDFGGAGQQLAAFAPKMMQDVINSKTGNKYANLTDGARKYVELMAGIKANDFSEMLFSSVMNRMFPFQFNFTPRNLKEAEIVQQIIHRFKWAALPELWAEGSDNAAFYKAPYTFDIGFVNVETGNQSKYWTKFGTCALVNISINRTPNGVFSVIKDESGEFIPQQVTIELQLTELTKLNKTANSDPNDSY